MNRGRSAAAIVVAPYVSVMERGFQSGALPVVVVIDLLVAARSMSTSVSVSHWEASVAETFHCHCWSGVVAPDPAMGAVPPCGSMLVS